MITLFVFRNIEIEHPYIFQSVASSELPRSILAEITAANKMGTKSHENR